MEMHSLGSVFSRDKPLASMPPEDVLALAAVSVRAAFESLAREAGGYVNIVQVTDLEILSTPYDEVRARLTCEVKK